MAGLDALKDCGSWTQSSPVVLFPGPRVPAGLDLVGHGSPDHSLAPAGGLVG